jgi:tRNA(Ile)-lysidine synthase
MSVLADNLVERVGEIIPRYSMLSEGDAVGVAVSGGADSVVLLHVLHRLALRFQVQLRVLHLNHQLRGAESDSDEEFVRSLANSLGLESSFERAEIQGGNLEQTARDARRAFFRRCMETHNLRRVALGHTRSDQAETVLFRLLRGSGLAGLAGIRMVTGDGLIRPLLTTGREEVRGWAVAEQIEWREDSTNANLAFARNRLRNEAIPALAREFNPNLEQVLSGTAELAQAEEEYWSEQIEPLYMEITKRTQAAEHLGLILNTSLLADLHRAVQRRLVRRALTALRGDLRSIDKEHVDAILTICSSRHGHDRVIVPGVDALRSFDQLLLTRPGELSSRGRDYRFKLNRGELCQLPFEAGSICVNWGKPSADFCANFKEDQQFPAEVANLNGQLLTSAGEHRPLYVRNWKPGDKLLRPGHREAENIKSLFQEHRILLWERRHWPVVLAGDEIVWVRRFGVSAKFSASDESRDAIRLVYRANRE